MLQQAALDVIIRHTYAQSRLEIAKLQHDSLQLGILEPVVEHLLQERSAAVRAYHEHIDTHAQKQPKAEFRVGLYPTPSRPYCAPTLPCVAVFRFVAAITSRDCRHRFKCPLTVPF